MNTLLWQTYAATSCGAIDAELGGIAELSKRTGDEKMVDPQSWAKGASAVEAAIMQVIGVYQPSRKG